MATKLKIIEDVADIVPAPTIPESQGPTEASRRAIIWGMMRTNARLPWDWNSTPPPPASAGPVWNEAPGLTCARACRLAPIAVFRGRS